MTRRSKSRIRSAPSNQRGGFAWGLVLLHLSGLLVHLAAGEAAIGQEPPRRTPDQVLLVINTASPISRDIGKAYAEKRHVDQIVQVQCPDSALDEGNESISLKEYQDAIERPIRAFLGTHRSIDFIVLTKGIPIRVRGGKTGNTSGDGRLKGMPVPSLDSTLAALDYDTIPGAEKYVFTAAETGGATGYAWANRYWNANQPFSHAKFGGYLVSRLDGYTREDAIALVSHAITAEESPPLGPVLLDIQPDFGIDPLSSQPDPLTLLTISRESPWSFFNTDLAVAASHLEKRGVRFELDSRSDFVGNRDDLAGYWSWGSNDSHFKPESYQSLRFAPGSISDTAVSTCARTFLHTEGGQSLTADLIAHGLTAAKGYCNEPLLQAIASPTVTLDCYYAGYTMAESFFMGSHFLGWEDIVIGDPLCAPHRKR